MKAAPRSRPITPRETTQVKQVIVRSSLVLGLVSFIGIGSGVFGFLEPSFLGAVWLVPAFVLGVLFLVVGTVKVGQGVVDLRRGDVFVAFGRVGVRHLVAHQTQWYVAIPHRRLYLSGQANVRGEIALDAEVEVLYLPRSGAVLAVSVGSPGGDHEPSE
jgi:hypothetical protein